ncbi:MAG: triphosphoribosyl-dephospho-CoA synthase [Hyphomicrobium sp.]|nr:triphosphoribosyl-dephospho-CoA synthase [Hyphomicrobium sp.]
MSWPLSRETISAAYISACRLEVEALKPGNVHVYAAGHGMEVRDFELSAEVSAPHVADPELPVGARILRAVEATFAAVGCNTNLGIVLLSAPIAAAAGPRGKGRTIQERLRSVLSGLDQGDATLAFKAIALAKPAGLSDAPSADVNDPAPVQVTLLQAMTLAAGRDLIAGEYARNYTVVTNTSRLFEHQQSAHGLKPEAALAKVFMLNLAHRLDTHIVRKQGREAAESVRERARRLVGTWPTLGVDVSEPPIIDSLLALDRDLKSEGLNPGSLADIMAAAAFMSKLRDAARKG